MQREATHSSLINLAHPWQDVHRERQHEPNLHRYKVAESLLPQNARGLSVLELGGGIGEFSRRMKARGINVTFVDLSEHNIRKAHELGLNTYQLDLNSGLHPFGEATFDGIVMLEIIEHIVSAEFLLEECHRVLKRGGFLILSTPNFAFFLNRLRILFGKLSHDEGYHYRFFTVTSLRDHLERAGFTIDRSAHTMPAFGVNFIANRLMKKDRMHLHVPDIAAPLLAHTLFVKAVKV